MSWILSNLHKQVRWGGYHIASVPSKTAILLICRNLVLLYNKFHIHYEKRKTEEERKKEEREGERLVVVATWEIS